MTRDELFSAVQKNLEEHQVKFTATPEEGVFDLHIQGTEGCWRATIVCEEDPLMVHVVCQLGLKPAQGAVLRMSQLMHGLNNRIRLGSFYLGPCGFPFYRLALPVFTEADIDGQVGRLIGTAMSTMEQHLRALSFAGTDTPEVRRQISEFVPAADDKDKAEASIPKSRLELN